MTAKKKLKKGQAGSNKQKRSASGQFVGKKLKNKNDSYTTVVKTLDKLLAMKLINKNFYKNIMLGVVNTNLEEFSRQKGMLPKAVPAPVLVSTKDGLVGRPLAIGDRHPDYTDWRSAEDLGKDWGLSSDKVRAFITQYEGGVPLRANGLAEEWVSQFGFPKPDSYGLLQFMNEPKNCVAVWAMREGGGINWRNYWSPEASQEIYNSIQAKMGPPPAQIPVLNPNAEPSRA